MYHQIWGPRNCVFGIKLNGKWSANIIQNIDPIAVKPAPIERSQWELSIGTDFMEIASIFESMWTKRMDDQFLMAKYLENVSHPGF